MIYDMMYRDGANYKQTFRAEIDDPDKQPEDEMYMEDAHMTVGEFFRFFGWPYDPDIDHNILEVLGKSEDQETAADIELFT